MINSTIQTITNASIFTAIGGTTAYVASSYKAILPAVPRLNPFKASPIGLTAPVASRDHRRIFCGEPHDICHLCARKRAANGLIYP